MDVNPYESPREAYEPRLQKPTEGSLLVASLVGIGVMTVSMLTVYGPILCFAVLMTQFQ
jgi:hypothetical protein